MIPKIHSGNNFYGVLNYLESKKHSVEKKTEISDETQSDKGFERLGVYNLLANLSEPKAELANDFNRFNESVQTKKSKTKKSVFHASLSLKESEIISNEKFLDIAEAFMKKMGYEKQPYVVYRHYDKAHPHIHIVSSRIGHDGKKISDSNEAKKAIKYCRELESQYCLQSINQPISKGSSMNRNFSQSPTPYHPAISFKKNIVDHLSYAIRKHSGITMAELNGYLIRNGIEMETSNRNGKTVVVFYGLNSAGERISRLPGSAIGKKLFERLTVVTKPRETQPQQGFNRKAILLALTEINTAEIINDAVIKAGLHSHHFNLSKVSSRHIPNGAKVAEIMGKADQIETFLIKYLDNGRNMFDSLKEIQKRFGFSFYAFSAKNGTPKIVYREKGKSVFVTDYLKTDFKNLLYQHLLTGNDSFLSNPDLYLKPDSALNDLLAPKLAIVYEILNRNPVFGLNHILEAGKLVGLDFSILADVNGLKGLTIKYQGRLVKTSILSDGERKLSSIEIKPKFNYQYSGAADLHLNNDQMNRLSDPPELNSLMTEIFIRQENTALGLAALNDKDINILLASIQTKYIHSSEIKNSANISKDVKLIKDKPTKKVVRSMASWLHKGVTNKGLDSLQEDIYTLKIT